MKPLARVLLILASLMLGLMFLFPLWKISLQAPQYPEGLGMQIWINEVRGEGEFDLTNINGLNHYIGMARITPEAIPELKIMPWIVIGLGALGLLTAATGKRWMLTLWIAAFTVVAIAGLVDFYMWEYAYGHNLNPHAAIKVPGMTYQPPLIGSKQLLNITALSLPSIGALAAGVALMLGVLALLINRKQSKTPRQVQNPSTSRVAVPEGV